MGIPVARTVLSGLALAGAVAATSAGYLAHADRRDRRRFPPPGKIVDVPGHGRRHLWLRGRADRGVPVVVVVTGLGGSVLECAALTDELKNHAQVLLYDRAGLGWSEPTRRRATTVDDMVGELGALLAVCRRPGPYVLVGHGIGGAVARRYAGRHPEQVVGLVVDDDADHDATSPERARPVGLRRLAHDVGVTPALRAAAARSTPEAWLDARIAHDLGRNTRRGAAAERAGLAAGPAVTPDLADLPLTVVTGGRAAVLDAVVEALRTASADPDRSPAPAPGAAGRG